MIFSTKIYVFLIIKIKMSTASGPLLPYCLFFACMCLYLWLETLAYVVPPDYVINWQDTDGLPAWLVVILIVCRKAYECG